MQAYAFPTNNQRLLKTFGFSSDDLEANRSGQLSDSQRTRIWLRFLTNIGGFGSFVVLLVVLGGIAAFGGQYMVALWTVGISGLLGYLLWRQARGTQQALSLGMVDAARGTVTLARRSQSTGQPHVTTTVPVAKVGAMQFDLREWQARALAEGGEYTFYYLRGLGVIVGVERHDFSFPMM